MPSDAQLNSLEELRSYVDLGFRVRVIRGRDVFDAWLEMEGKVPIPLDEDQYDSLAAYARELDERERIPHAAFVGSSHLHSYGYREEDQVLEVRFVGKGDGGSGGAVYRYTGVTRDELTLLLAAPSKTAFLNGVIAKSHPYAKVDERPRVQIDHASLVEETLPL